MGYIGHEKEVKKMEGIRNYRFYIRLGIITILASILTMIITQIIKVILKKKKIIYDGMEESKRDILLCRIGRIVALIIYSGLYIAKEMYFHKTITLNGTVISGLLVGATGTLIIAKGIYTILHQWSTKNTVFERLEYVENVRNELEEELSKIKENNEEKIKWILTNKKK